jgi:hypothetical protein
VLDKCGYPRRTLKLVNKWAESLGRSALLKGIGDKLKPGQTETLQFVR